jgi:thiamine-phosphate pyrophosphorylase
MMSRGLYAITDPILTPPDLIVGKVEESLLGGACMVQYRAKDADPMRRRQQAAALLELCNRYSVPLIINDDVALASAIGAQGVHLGRDDMDIGEARASLGPTAIIGASCYDDLARAVRAQRQGADYVAFGSMFASTTKPAAPTASTQILQYAQARLSVAVCAIGGITVDNAKTLVDAGADLLAVISGLFAQPNPREAAQAFAALFD